jgi:hypothetical protein
MPRSPTFEWVPLAGATYYRVQIANNELFNGAITTTTDATPLHAHRATKQGCVRVGNTINLPAVLRQRLLCPNGSRSETHIEGLRGLGAYYVKPVI